MPELPDVAHFKKYLDATALHQQIEKTSVPDDRILDNASGAKIARALKGRELKSSRRHGKYLFVETTGGPWLVLHFGMTGSLKYYGTEDDAPPNPRLLLHFKNGKCLAFDCPRMFGEVTLADDVDAFLERKEMGPDAAEIDLRAFRERLKGRKGAIKPTLMNQSVVAGLGNVWTDETLFQAGIHPKRKVEDLSGDEVKDIFRAMQSLFRKSAKYVGDRVFPDSWLLSHRGEGEKCPKCGGEVKPIETSGRRGYHCPNCQN